MDFHKEWWKKSHVPIVLFVLFASYFYWDRPLACWAAHLPAWVEKYADIASQLCNPSVHLVVWPVVFYFYAFILRKSAVKKGLLFILLCIPIVILAVDILKPLLGRARPQLWVGDSIYGFYGWKISNKWHSFPSGHAAIIGALMGALRCFHPSYWPLFLLLALALGFLRVLGNDHYFSDIWGTVFFAFYLVQAVYLHYQRRSSLWKLF